MKIQNRAFDDRKFDFDRLWQFLVDDYAVRQERFIWTIGRLGDWKFGIWNEEKYFPSFMRKNAQLWFNNFDELIGFVISENGDSYFNFFARRGYEFLYSEMLQWAITNWNDRNGALSTDAHEDHHLLMQELEKAGFRKNGASAITGQYHLRVKAAEGIVLREEYSIQDMLANPDLRGKAMLGINAWSNGTRTEALNKLDLLKYEYNRESPCFSPEFDLSVVDQEGRHLSSCVAFVDYKNNYAEIEKVCTHTEYRRKGLAEAVIRECFHRLHQKGIEYAYLTGFGPEAQNLYNKLGPAQSVNLYSYVLGEN
ncbi:Acetyltransferase (GNAT) family protein [compost metagenome]